MTTGLGVEDVSLEELLRPPGGVTGLSSEEAARRLVRDGTNDLVPERAGGRWLRWLRPFADPMVLLLLLAGPTYIVLGDHLDAAITLSAIVPIAAIGWLLESRAERVLDRLRGLNAPTVVVWRDGRHQVVPARQLVIGDLILLHEGDVIPADGELVATTQLMVDESSLTGESWPVAKGADDLALLAGTTVLSGRAMARVTVTGPATQYGTIGQLVAHIRPPRTPLQIAVLRLVRIVGIVAFAFCAGVFVVERVRGSSIGDALIAAVSLGIAAVPEEFPMVYTLYLALGAWRLARDNALVRAVTGVETLGGTTVIAVDKTGTLTQGQLEAAAIVTPDGTIHPVTDGGIDNASRPVVHAALLASEPSPFDPLDQAIARLAAAAGLRQPPADRLAVDHPFDPALRRVTHIWCDGDGCAVASKGAAEGLGVGLMADSNERLAQAGMRIVSVALGRIGQPSLTRAGDEATLRPVGLIAFADPVRAGVDQAIKDCQSAGIRVVMVTGDHPSTARAVGGQLGIGTAASVVSGAEIDQATDDELNRLVSEASVFVRTRPDQKHRLVDAFRRAGHVVAMTGDGINDAPALRQADVGVAMGLRGTAVAREAANLVLLDDNFTTIVRAVRDARRIVENLGRAFRYLIAFHPPLLLAALIVPLLNRPLLLLPVHLIALELVLHPIISVVFEREPASADVMSRPPRRAQEVLIGLRTVRPLALGLTLSAATIGAYLVGLHRLPVEQARAFAWSVLLAGQASLVFVCRAPARPCWRGLHSADRSLWYAGGAVVVALVASIYVGPLARAAQLAPISVRWLSAALALALGSTLWSEVGWRVRTPGSATGTTA